MSLLKGVLFIRLLVDCWYLRISHKANNPGQYLCRFLIPPVTEFHLSIFHKICLHSCFPPFVIFLAVGFKGTLLSWTSLPMAADGLSRTKFLGVCFVCAMFPIENKGYISIFRLQVEENKGVHIYSERHMFLYLSLGYKYMLKYL